MVKNYTEIAVDEVFDDVLAGFLQQRPDMCTCPRCRDDIKALALNSLPPRYVATDKGEIFTKVAFDLVGGKAHIIAALWKAMEQVWRKPHR